MADSFVKDFSINKLNLTSVNGEILNLRNVMVELNIFEDIYNNNTTCSLVISDANNLIMNLPIFGYETLEVEFETPNKEVYSKTFRLISIADRGLVRERQLAYTLHFVTPEVITNLTARVSKSYKGKLISDIVSDLHKNWLKSHQTLNVEETQIQHHIIIPNLYPAQAINWLATRSVSSTQKGANYLYFEDKYGFNFISLESCLEAPTSKKYIFHIGNVRKDSNLTVTYESDLIAADSYTLENHSDILDNLRNGMYGNRLVVHDPINKTLKKYDFDYNSSFDNYKHLYAGNPLYSATADDLVSADSRLKVHSSGQDEYPFYPEQWIPARISQLQQLQNVRLTMTIPGDSERTIGEVVEFNLPSPEPPIENQQITDQYYAGRYLVQSVRHVLTNVKYITAMELVKDSTFEQYP